MCCSFDFRGRNIRPAGEATVLDAGRTELQLRFGFPLAGGRLIINARAESAAEKPLFRGPLAHGRILIPADCFHEWDKDRVKHTFLLPGRQAMLRFRTPENIRECSRRVGALAEKLSCHAINVNRGLNDAGGELKAEYTTDGVHMTAEAYTVIFENLLPFLRQER